jgi:hypothetical protein
MNEEDQKQLDADFQRLTDNVRDELEEEIREDLTKESIHYRGYLAASREASHRRFVK